MQQHSRLPASLVDLLIGAILLCVLTATVVSSKFGRDRDPREVSLLLDLELLRARIETYRIQHEGANPGLAGTPDGLRRDLASRLPVNPYNGGRGVWIVEDVDATVPDESRRDGNEPAGWIYSPTQGRVKANASAFAVDGQSLDRL